LQCDLKSGIVDMFAVELHHDLENLNQPVNIPHYDILVSPRYCWVHPVCRIDLGKLPFR